jgi:hypothetical protein
LQSRIWNAVSASVTIEERDEVYQAVEEFLADNSERHEFNNLLATTVVGSNLQQRRVQGDGQSDSIVKYTPGNNHTNFEPGDKFSFADNFLIDFTHQLRTQGMEIIVFNSKERRSGYAKIPSYSIYNPMNHRSLLRGRHIKWRISQLGYGRYQEAQLAFKNLSIRPLNLLKRDMMER